MPWRYAAVPVERLAARRFRECGWRRIERSKLRAEIRQSAKSGVQIDKTGQGIAGVWVPGTHVDRHGDRSDLTDRTVT